MEHPPPTKVTFSGEYVLYNNTLNRGPLNGSCRKGVPKTLQNAKNGHFLADPATFGQKLGFGPDLAKMGRTDQK